MTDFLERVVAERRADAAARPRAPRVAAAAPRAARSLTDALGTRRDGGRLAVIAEVKRVSPALGPLAPSLDPAALARTYAAAGAAAISVLVERRHWGGSLDDLRAARAAVGPEVPLLAKDIVVDAAQVDDAADAGADAILLIAEALDDEALAFLLRAAHDRGLEALVEAHEPEAFARAVRSGARLLGVNARDLRDPARIDLDRVHGLAPLVPGEGLLVAESGIGSAAAARALPARVDAILVGTALVTAPDPGALLRELADVRRARHAA